MVSNPSVNYMLYEYLRARLEDWRRVLAVGEVKFQKTSPAGASCLRCFMRAQIQMCLSLEGTPALWKMQLQGAFEFWDAIIGVQRDWQHIPIGCLTINSQCSPVQHAR